MTVEALAAILADVAAGVAIRVALETHGVNPREFYAARANDDELAKRYARAKEVAVEAMADEILEIADDGARDYTETVDGRTVPDHDHIQRSRLRVDTRKWLLSKLAPKKYGEKLDLNHSGELAVSITPADAGL